MAPDVGDEVASDNARSRGSSHGAVLLAISNAMVRLHKEYFGKGPTKARAYYEGDVVTCVLSDVYTRAELTLLAGGREATVLRQRWELQEVVRDEFVSAVERITGRTVIGFFSGNQADPDMSVVVFVLAPMDGDGS